MRQTLLNQKIFLVVFVSLSLVGAVFAQNSSRPVRRNSPFAPNPKKKAAAPKLPVADSAEKIAKAETSTAQIESNVTDSPAQAEKPASQMENGQVQRAAFEKSPAIPKNSANEKTVADAVKVSPTDIYKVGVGDVLFISLQNAPSKESTYFTVLENGTIDYPLAGAMIPVQGLTTAEIETALQEKVKLYENPQISVKVREHNSHTFTVIGMVEKAGEKTMQREAMPLYVVSAEAVVEPRANRAVIRRNRSVLTETVDLKDSKKDDVLIYAGDIVEFGASDTTASANGASSPQFYYIGGEIASGGQKDFYHGITLTQAILACGGLKKSTVKKIVVRRKNETGMLVPANYDLKAIKDGKAPDPTLEAGDTIEIGN